MITIEEMKANGVQVESKLEITLKEGAEFDDDTGPAGAVDPDGFEPTYKMTDNPGLTFLGYVSEIGKDPDSKRVFLNQGWNPSEGRPAIRGGSRLYFHEDVILDYDKN